MNNSILVSIVTPSFNSGRFITETIESVRSQNYPCIEHIVIDGASTDNTIEILKSYPHLIWFSEADNGQSGALNKGFRLANGEIIGWLNADDTYQPGSITTVVDFLEKNPDIDVVYSDVRVIDENGLEIGVSKSREFNIWHLVESNFIKQPTVFMRRRVMEKLKGVDEDLHYVMDREFWLRMGLAGFKFHYLDEQVLANFRKCEGTKSFEYGPRFSAEWAQVLEKLLDEPYFDDIKSSTKRQVVRKFYSQAYFSRSMLAIQKKKWIEMLLFFYQAVSKEPWSLLNRGTWYTLGMGLIGRGVDWRKKYNY